MTPGAFSRSLPADADQLIPMHGRDGHPGDKNKQSHWFDVPEGYALECLVLEEGEQRRVYIVTTDAPAEYA